MQSSRLLLLALAATIGLTLWTQMRPGTDDDTDLAAPARPRPSAGIAGQVHSTLPQTTDIAADWQLQAASSLPAAVDLFAAAAMPTPAGPPAAHTSTVMPHRIAPATQPVAAPAPPAAPPLPVQYLGRMIDGPTALLFVVQNGDSLALKPGDVVAGSYRLERINDRHAVFTYLPLNQTQNLALGDLL